MRLFLAIDLPIKVRQSLSRQTAEFKKKFPDFNWVEEDNFHITLLFLGEMTDTKELKEKIKAVIYDKAHFYLYSYKTDLFMKEKIVIYLGFNRERKIEELTQALKTAFRQDDNKKYLPHLTLAKCRIPSKQQYFVLKKFLHKQKIEIDFPVKKFYLFQSITTGKKPIYKKLAAFSLI